MEKTSTSVIYLIDNKSLASTWHQGRKLEEHPFAPFTSSLGASKYIFLYFIATQ